MTQSLPRRLSSIALLGTLCLALGSCGGTAPSSGETAQVSGARSAVFVIEDLMDSQVASVRPGALIGLYVTEFLSRGTAAAVQSALKGIDAQTALAAETSDEPTDEDFELLQAFADALSVDVPELLNRSSDREETLSRYIDALRNVGTRAKTRFDELGVAIENIRDTQREQNKEVTDVKRRQRDAVREKDFTTASELQRELNELEAGVADTELKLSQTRNIEETFDDLLAIYGERLLALEANRQALITGVTVVDVPGADELEILNTPSRRDQRRGIDSLLRGGGLSEFLGIDGSLE